MPVSRRDFVRTMGLSTGALSGGLALPFVTGRGMEEAQAMEPGGAASGGATASPASARALQQVYDDGVIRISSNENARGPGSSAIRAIRDAMSPRMGRGYPPDHRGELTTTIAGLFDVEDRNVVVGTGSGAILEGATRAFCDADRHLVTAAPSYGTPERAAREIGAEVRAVPVTGDMALDLDAMADAAVGAGMVFFCNPNNPTGTAYSAEVTEAFVREVKDRSPETAILVDEAYIDYRHDPSISTVAHVAMELPGVFITRSLSKAHGMAGLRIGYAVGQAETVGAITDAWNLGSMNTLSAAAAIASLRDPGHIADERAENARIRTFTLNAFREMGYEVQDTHTNFVFVDLGMPSSAFREPCLERGVRVGRDFPPMERTHTRISLGTMEEMEKAVDVFREVLQG